MHGVSVGHDSRTYALLDFYNKLSDHVLLRSLYVFKSTLATSTQLKTLRVARSFRPRGNRLTSLINLKRRRALVKNRNEKQLHFLIDTKKIVIKRQEDSQNVPDEAELKEREMMKQGVGLLLTSPDHVTPLEKCV